jgi:prokaryotic ubiquitin-like protein Pup
MVLTVLRLVPPSTDAEDRSEPMMRVQERRRYHHRGGTESASENTAPAQVAEDLKHDLDDVLDEIDAVLEENAEEFVAAYVQKGGQ